MMKSWLRRLPPLRDTLFIRLALLVIMAVLASQIFTLWLTIKQKNELLSRQLYAQVLDTLANYEGVLDTIHISQRDQFLFDSNQPGMPRLLPLSAIHDYSELLPPTAQSLRARLSEVIGEDIQAVIVNDGQRELWMRVPMLDRYYWLAVPLHRYLPPEVRPTLQAAGLVALLSVLAAFALAWRTTLPLSRLAQATRELESGRTPGQLISSGPSEVRELTERFNQMTQALEKAAGERRLMLAGLSHDLRTPLTRLKLSIEMEDDLADKDGMLSDIDDLSRIIGQFIDFARSEEKCSLLPLALDEIASNVLEKFARGGMTVDSELAAAQIKGDALGLQRLIGNLLENARRYGAAPFALKLACEGNQAVLRVCDQGQGIPPELQQAALAPFERLNTHRGGDGGSGLGLAIVSRIVQLHGGKLSFELPEAGGFAVVIRFPLVIR